MEPGPMRAYRHREGHCSRLLFEAYLPPGTHIRVRCPACGGMHDIIMPPPHLNGFAKVNGNGHVNLSSTGTLDIQEGSD